MSLLKEPFLLERYFAEHEFCTKHLLCCSDPETMSMAELISMGDKECLEMWNTLSLGYTDSKGHPKLREEICQLYSGVAPDEISIMVPNEAIYVAMKAMFHIVSEEGEPKPHVIVTFPAYQSLYQNMKASGCDLSYWTVVDTGSHWHFDIDALEALIQPNTKIMIVNFPHNPTGYVPTPDDWNQIIGICQSHDIFLFSDEMYRLSNNDGTLPLSSACTLYNKAMTLSGLSKTFGLPGLRIGWLVSKNKQLMLACDRYRDYLTICSSAPSEILSIIALRNKDAIINRNLQIIRENLGLLDSFFHRMKKFFVWYKPSACTTGFLRLTSPALELGGGTASGFCEYILENCQVLLLPASKYCFEDRYLRVGFGRLSLAHALVALEKCLTRA